METNAAAVLTALADPTRRTIYERVARRPVPVGELARDLPVSRPAVSQHLKVLQDAGLVRHEQVGTRRIYALDSTGLIEVRQYFEQFWQQALAAFATAATTTIREEA